MRVLQLYGEMRSESLDLHTLFELAGGSDPVEREAVLDAVEALVSKHMLEERGNDYYALTELGAKVATLRDAVNAPEPAEQPASLAARVAIYASFVALLLFLLLAYQCS